MTNVIRLCNTVSCTASKNACLQGHFRAVGHAQKKRCGTEAQNDKKLLFQKGNSIFVLEFVKKERRVIYIVYKNLTVFLPTSFTKEVGFAC